MTTLKFTKNRIHASNKFKKTMWFIIGLLKGARNKRMECLHIYTAELMMELKPKELSNGISFIMMFSSVSSSHFLPSPFQSLPRTFQFPQDSRSARPR